MPARQRAYTWDDPAQTAGPGREMDGLSFLRAVAEGRVPSCPMQRTLDYDLVDVERGRVVFRGRPSEYLYNPLGSVHGAYYAALLDSALGCAIHSTLAAGQVYTTLEFKLNLVRALSADSGEVRAEARVLHCGRRIGTAEGRLTDGQGRLCAHGTTTCLILPGAGG